MRWEYKRVNVEIGEVTSDDFEERLNDLGAEGWEVAFAIDQQRHGFSKHVYVVLKRPVSEAGYLASDHFPVAR